MAYCKDCLHYELCDAYMMTVTFPVDDGVCTGFAYRDRWAEVVRCKDCKHYHAELGWCDEHSHFIDADRAFCHPWESSEWKMFDADYFCADGERKDGEG